MPEAEFEKFCHEIVSCAETYNSLSDNNYHVVIPGAGLELDEIKKVKAHVHNSHRLRTEQVKFALATKALGLP